MKKSKSWFKIICWALLASFSFNATGFAAPVAGLNLPAPSRLVGLSTPMSGPVLRGVKINPNNPLQIEFVVSSGSQNAVSKEEFNRLVSYFLAALTVPENDLWVNLSPYEQNRVISTQLSQTDFGKDLLEEDYLLKQLASSLTYPENETGKRYWQTIYSRINQITQNNNLTVNAISKVWIVPAQAQIYENENAAVITEARLKVLTEHDYFASQQVNLTTDQSQNPLQDELTSQAIKETVIPQIEQEVNAGKNFSRLRQMYYSFLLASWFKNKLKDSFFKYYLDQNKIKGIDLSDKTIKEKIYNQYVQAFKQGVYNYIKKEAVSPNRTVHRRYFSGGVTLANSGVGSKTVEVVHASSNVLQKLTGVTALGLLGVTCTYNTYDLQGTCTSGPDAAANTAPAPEAGVTTPPDLITTVPAMPDNAPGAIPLNYSSPNISVTTYGDAIVAENPQTGGTYFTTTSTGFAGLLFSWTKPITITDFDLYIAIDSATGGLQTLFPQAVTILTGNYNGNNVFPIVNGNERINLIPGTVIKLTIPKDVNLSKYQTDMLRLDADVVHDPKNTPGTVSFRATLVPKTPGSVVTGDTDAATMPDSAATPDGGQASSTIANKRVEKPNNRTANPEGGVKFTYSATASSGLDPITIKVTPEMEALFKNAEAVNIKINKFGYQVDIEQFIGRQENFLQK